MAETPRHFQRDPNAGAHLAAQFGAGAGTAEQLIEANSMRYSEELLAANRLPVDEKATSEVDRAAVAKAAGVEEKDILSVAVRGSYVTYVAEEGGRTNKGVLTRDGDSLEAPDDSSDPRRARIAAQAEAAKQVQEAQAKADKIIAEAQEKAAKMVAEAAQKGEEEASKKQQEAAEKQSKSEGDGEGQASSETQASGPSEGEESKPAEEPQSGARRRPRS